MLARMYDSDCGAIVLPDMPLKQKIRTVTSICR